MSPLAQPYAIALIVLPISLCLYRLLSNAFRPGLRQIPGPPLARYTSLWRAYWVSNGNAHQSYRDIHARYGPIVRTAPNVIDISDPAVIPVIFGISSKYTKSNFYNIWQTPPSPHTGKSLPNLFATRDEEEHKHIKRPVSQKFSMTSIRSMEYLVDPRSKVFTDAMMDMAGQVVDLGEWVQWYAFDVIAAISFSKDFGFMEQRRDVDNAVAALEGRFERWSLAGQVPWLSEGLGGWFGYRRIEQWVASWTADERDPIAICARMVAESIKAYDAEEARKTNRGDFLAYAEQSDKIDQTAKFALLMGNLIAGSDTTGISLRAVFYYLIQNPHTYKRLQQEIDDAHAAGKLSPCITYAESLQLEYLQAVMKEAMRIHPAVAFPLERVVPAGGATLCNTYLPPGTVVGVNPFVIHRNTDVYGSDANEFRPERWLDGDEEQIKTMDRSLLIFGGGTRTCTGKNISLMEMGKLVPQVLRQFDLEWASEEPHWQVKTYWFAKQKGLLVRMKPRKEYANKAN